MQTKPANRNLGLTAAACAVFVAGMVGASFAAVPLYALFCQVTGFGGTTQRAEAAPDTTIDRYVTVRFDANVGNNLGWSFRPEIRSVRVKLGEIGEMRYIAENRTTDPSTGTATFNVAPGEAGLYFSKIACFCFTEQTLQAGERVEMPVTFFVDPALVDDPDYGATSTITLSYTFYPVSDPARPLAAAAAVERDQEAL
jgi:cytochrome c oxidase assembly protein subunit 11